MHFIVIASAILLLDQVSKQWVLGGHSPFTVSFNEGVAFSLPITGTLAIVIATLLTVLLAFSCFRFFRPVPLRDLIFGLIIGGALSNLLDRLIFGKVIDFIQIGNFPSFNLADSAITVGFFLLIIVLEKIKK